MKIELNKKLDKEVYLDFRDTIIVGADFGKKIQIDHPNITKENYSEYIDSFYTTNISILNDAIKNTELCFSEIKDILFSELQKYFYHDYSKENYICYLSIFNCNPRYLENKSFQIYYKRSHSMRKEVIAHELTHFAFYDYCLHLGIKESNNLWELSEIFNVIFLNLPLIQKTIGAEEMLFYPNLKDKFKKIKEIWNKNFSAKEFIEKSMEYLMSILKAQ